MQQVCKGRSTGAAAPEWDFQDTNGHGLTNGGPWNMQQHSHQHGNGQGHWLRGSSNVQQRAVGHNRDTDSQGLPLHTFHRAVQALAGREALTFLLQDLPAPLGCKYVWALRPLICTFPEAFTSMLDVTERLVADVAAPPITGTSVSHGGVETAPAAAITDEATVSDSKPPAAAAHGNGQDANELLVVQCVLALLHVRQPPGGDCSAQRMRNVLQAVLLRAKPSLQGRMRQQLTLTWPQLADATAGSCSGGSSTFAGDSNSPLLLEVQRMLFEQLPGTADAVADPHLNPPTAAAPNASKVAQSFCGDERSLNASPLGSERGSSEQVVALGSVLQALLTTLALVPQGAALNHKTVPEASNKQPQDSDARMNYKHEHARTHSEQAISDTNGLAGPRASAVQQQQQQYKLLLHPSLDKQQVLLVLGRLLHHAAHATGTLQGAGCADPTSPQSTAAAGAGDRSAHMLTGARQAAVPGTVGGNAAAAVDSGALQAAHCCDAFLECMALAPETALLVALAAAGLGWDCVAGESCPSVLSPTRHTR